MKKNFIFYWLVVENKKDIDVYVRDCFGKEYVIWPGKKKTILMIKAKENDRK